MFRSPTRRILILAVLLNMVSFMDRICISVAAPRLRAELGFTATQTGFIFSAFSLTYALLQVPWGILADRFGGRRLATIGILGWSAFTALTAAASNVGSMIAVRLAFGALEAALLPSIASAFGRCIPAQERSTAFGVLLSGGRFGGVLAPALASFLILNYGWRSGFLAFALLGVVAGSAWHLGTKDIPDGRVARENVAGDGIRHLGKLTLSLPLALLLLVVFGYTFMWQFYATWFPTYLAEYRRLSWSEASRYSGLPFLFGLIGNWIGGISADVLSRRVGARMGRGAVGALALLASAILLYAGVRAGDPRKAALLIALAPGVGDLILAACWAWASEIGAENAGTASGLMNSASNLGGMVSPALLGWVLTISNSWNTVLLIAVVVNAVCAFLWLGVSKPADRAASVASQHRLKI